MFGTKRAASVSEHSHEMPSSLSSAPVMLLQPEGSLRSSSLLTPDPLTLALFPRVRVHVTT